VGVATFKRSEICVNIIEELMNVSTLLGELLQLYKDYNNMAF